MPQGENRMESGLGADSKRSWLMQMGGSINGSRIEKAGQKEQVICS